MKLFNDSELWCIQIVFCISAACGDVKSAGSHYLHESVCIYFDELKQYVWVKIQNKLYEYKQLPINAHS